ncbi:M3 family metallopeptidase [Myxococcota bacterium]|nr:M3 family metallopeptidase [Myxococcota bacterium]MBU1431712.1 M3 family metallopeptidase [Myxococcota bacterium]MBU1900704.1 M3 family metallopeptidase [Myxococcota bacterium]
MISSSNPFIEHAFPLRFDAFKAEDVVEAIDALLASARAGLDAITSASTLSWSATAGRLDTLTKRLSLVMGLLDHLEGVLGDAAWREAQAEVLPRVSAFQATLSLSRPLYDTLKAYAEGPEAAALDPARARFLKLTLDDLRREGAALGAEEKARLEAIGVALSALTTEFAQNVVDATDAYELIIEDAARLAGLPQSAIDAAAASAATAGRAGWRFTLQAPSFLAVMSHLEDASIREAMYRAYHRRAVDANVPLIEEILKLRAEKARLLGYADVADLHLEPRMVKTGAAAAAFVEEMAQRGRAYFEQERAALEDFCATRFGLAPPIPAWSLRWCAEAMRRETLGFDDEALRPYFSVDRVLAGMFEIAKRLYGVTITPLEGWPTWHPDVRVYALTEAGTRRGVFYADLFPRKGKRGGAWMHPLWVGQPREGQPHVATICANITAPLNGQPAQLTHMEVETLFHEFGHLLHHLLTEATVESLAGTDVAWDFVELPSQIMENWCWSKPALDLFARHFETDEPIPDALFAKLKAGRTFRAASAQARQLGFCAVDLALHRDFKPGEGDLLAFACALMQRFSPSPLPEGYAMITGFTHLFADAVGYAAGYYSYQWAEVLDADAFTRFEAEGVFNPEVGAAFREAILAPGNTEDPVILYRRFMGRAPDPSAALRRAGLV